MDMEIWTRIQREFEHETLVKETSESDRWQLRQRTFAPEPVYWDVMEISLYCPPTPEDPCLVNILLEMPYGKPGDSLVLS